MELMASLTSLKPNAALTKKLNELELEVAFTQALSEIQSANTTSEAAAHPQAVHAVARAIVAATIRIAVVDGISPPSIETLDEIAGDIEFQLLGGQLGPVGDFAKAAFAGIGTRLATRWGVSHREVLPATATPIAGDVIYYQAHGERIRARIHDAIARATEPVAVLAHSLGGIASFEAMCETPETRKRVTKFITAGSQSGYFYELDALRSLPFGQPLAADFPDWLNFWDSRDFLSFLTEGVFSGGRSRRDVEIKSGLPFPASHSGYWRQQKTWEHIRAFLKK
jgi:hypothetical protein